MTSVPPRLSYTIWFTQRTGSTWLCDALTATGIAGRPGEHLNQPTAAGTLEHYGVTTRSALLQKLHALGSTDNGVFGIKQGYTEPRFGNQLDLLADSGPPRLTCWAEAFPNHRHIFMTRRNKLRLAVSWWKAIKSGQWHRRDGEDPSSADLSGAYDALAIDRLMQEAVVREAGIQELFSETGVVPLEVVYEDAQHDLRGTVNRILSLLDLPPTDADISTPSLQPTADALTEEWVQRFREDRQAGWEGRGW